MKSNSCALAVAILGAVMASACGEGSGDAANDLNTSNSNVPTGHDSVVLTDIDLPTARSLLAVQPERNAERARIRAYLDMEHAPNDTRHFFETKLGQIIDCVDYFRHTSIKRLAAAGIDVSKIPTPPPPPDDLPPITKSLGDPSDDSFNGLPDSQGRRRSCPDGTVPTVRLTEDEILSAGGLDQFLAKLHKKSPPPSPSNMGRDQFLPNQHKTFSPPSPPDLDTYAHVTSGFLDSTSNITSTGSTLNILRPAFDVPNFSRHSLSQTWTMNAARDQTIEVGWTVFETGGFPRLFVFSTADGNKTTGCYNGVQTGGKCLDWHPVKKPVPVYAPWQELTPGPQNELTVRTEYKAPGDTPGYSGPAAWWIYVQGSAGGSYIGYYPASNYSNYGTGQMATRAQEFLVGGEIQEATESWGVPMGSGAAPTAGMAGPAGYHRNYSACLGGYAGGRTTCTSGGTYTTPTNFDTPEGTRPTHYSHAQSGGLSGWGPYFFYGDTPRVFWLQNYGFDWAPGGNDWLYGEYKGQCKLGQPITGLSKFTSGANQAHAILCGSKTINNVSSSCTVRVFDTGDARAPNTGTGDWDSGYYKGECASNEFVQGIAQTTSGRVNAILCCPGTVAHTGCSRQTFYSSNSSGYSNVDWDPNYFKGQCPTGRYVAGVSSVSSSNNGVVGAPHGILCCTQ